MEIFYDYLFRVKCCGHQVVKKFFRNTNWIMCAKHDEASTDISLNLTLLSIASIVT